MGHDGQKGKVRILSVLLVAIVLVCVAAVGSYWWLKTKLPDTAVPHQVSQIEKSLASGDLVGLFHANIKAAVQIEDTFLGRGDVTPLKSLSNTNFLSELEEAGIDLRSSLHHVIGSLHITGEEDAKFAAILLGRFSPDKVISFLRAKYELAETRSHGNTLYEFVQQDEKTCELERRAIHVTKDRIVISSPDFLPVLLERFETPSEETDLSGWNEYRKGKMASLAVFKPQQSYGSSEARDFSGLLLEAAQDEIEPVESIFASAAADLVKKGFVLDVALNTSDPEWVATTSGKWQNSIEESRTNISERLPSAARLYESIHISGKGNQLTARIALDRETVSNFKKVAAELFASVFDTSSIREKNGTAEKKEQLDENPRTFLSHYAPSTLAPFDPGLDPFMSPHWTGGPFGLEIKSIGLDEDQSVVFDLKAAGQRIENMGRYSEATITVDSVRARDGRNLLRIDKCGRTRNQQPTDFETDRFGQIYRDGELVKYSRMEASKKVHLVPEARPGDVESISGSISLDIPVETAIVTLPAPVNDQAVEKFGTRVFIIDASSDEITYDISGEKSRVLAVRALNSEKKYLSGGGWTSVDRLFSGTNVTSSFFGTVSFVEIVLAKRFETVTYDFKLSDVYPKFEEARAQQVSPIPTYSKKQYKAEFSDKAPPIVEKESWEKDPLATLEHGPVRLLLSDLRENVFGSPYGSMKVQSQPIPSVTENLSAVEIGISGLRYDDGSSIPLDEEAFLTLEPSGGRYGRVGADGKYEIVEIDKHLKGRTSISLDVKSKGKAIAALSGKVTLRFPTATKTERIEKIVLGKSVQEGPFSLQVVEIAKDSLKVRFTGPRKQLLRIQAIDDDGESIGIASDAKQEDEGWLATVNINGRPEHLELSYATRQEHIEFPFELEPIQNTSGSR